MEKYRGFMNSYAGWILAILILFQVLELQGQVQPTDKRYVRIGSLQSKFSAYGSERAWNNQYYEGMIWPADYFYQDNAVIERAWIAVDNFTDANGRMWPKRGTSLIEAYVGLTPPYTGASLFPVELKQTAKFELPDVYVDGSNISQPYKGDVDEIDPTIIPDRIVSNIVNTYLGITISKQIYAFSQQYHDNYFIKEYTYTNTGNVDYDDEIELNAPIQGLRIGWGIRYAVSREGSMKADNSQSWGKNSWVSRRGEDYASHAGETITEANPVVQWLRCGFSWMGQTETKSYDVIGAPDLTGYGRLAGPQFAGTVMIHVDKSPGDPSDDPNQPVVLGWHAGDTYPSLGDLTEAGPMEDLYTFLSGNPYKGLGNATERFDDVYLPTITSQVVPWKIHQDGGGTNVWWCYGPFNLQHGESIRIVEAEAVSGLSRAMCEQIGLRWKKAYSNPSDTGPFQLPPASGGGTTTNKDEYKNSWVYTGIDSILQTFGRARRNYDSNYQIPQPPWPPPIVQINSGGDRISLTWVASPSEANSDFAGYKIFRGVGKQDTLFQEIATVPRSVHSYDDVTPVRGFSYYYYISAVNDGTNNTSGATNPTGPLISGRFFTKTNQPAYLRRMAGMSLEEIRVVPNPYNIKARAWNYPNEQDKIGFLNIPAFCKINIYTESGDLIKTIDHTNGSGDEYWNSITESRQVVVSGLYIAYFEVTKDYPDPQTGRILYTKGEKTYRKFIIIR